MRARSLTVITAPFNFQKHFILSRLRKTKATYIVLTFKKESGKLVSF